MNTLSKQQWIVFSPLIVLGACHLTARVGASFIGKWAFIPVMICLWVVCIFFIYLSGENRIREKWLSTVKGKYGWKSMVLFVGLLPLPVFLMHWELLKPIEILIPYLLIVLINPFIEEFYWRGLLLDHLTHLPNWIAVLYTSFFFALYHPLSFGWFSDMNSGYSVFAATFIMGIVWAIGYKKIGNLRTIIFAHFMVDAFNVSVPAFLDLFDRTF